jgi:Ni/Fe-hydrogenase subunit HybB-like protein
MVPELKYGEINDDALSALQKPGFPYFFALATLAALLGWGAVCWLYQVQFGMGVTGLNRPVGWAVYITNFVFWVGIAHSGTLISAILYLLRADWRNAVSRASEAMTIFAIMTAGLFPLVHLGRLWAFYYIIPYPSQRTIWPNFLSPLVWDVCAVGTYFTVSLIFWLVGLIPDMAAARDRFEERHGEIFRTKLYRAMALGWSGAGSQWHHYGRSYLFFAALATPLVVSVHSVVSWDFAMSLLPGWHSAIFPPYFVAGAIHSGLAMVLTLMIPMRKLLHLERLIQVKHMEAVAKTIILTGSIVGYAYICEAFMAWYSGDIYESQLFNWRVTGTPAWMYWLCVVCNVLVPLLYLFKKLRTNFVPLFVISLLINVGMWFERLMIIYSSLAHDFLPHNWEPYTPTWVEISITLGSAGFFLFWFFGFTKLLPTVPVSELKEKVMEEQLEPGIGECETRVHQAIDPDRPSVLAIFSSAGNLLKAAKKSCDADFKVMETFSPVKIEALDEVLAQPKSPVRYITLIGALCGLAGGFWLAGGTATVNNLIVGGKPPLAWIPFCVIAFEGTILIGSLANLAGLVFFSRLTRIRTAPYYDERFSRDKFGLLVSCDSDDLNRLKELLAPTDPEEIHVHR